MSSFIVGIRYALYYIQLPTPTSTFTMTICVAFTLVSSAYSTGIAGILSISLKYLALVTTCSDAPLSTIISSQSCSPCCSLSCLFLLLKHFLLPLNNLPCYHSSTNYYCSYLYCSSCDTHHDLYFYQLLDLHEVTSNLLHNDQFYYNCKIALSSPSSDSMTVLFAFLSVQRQAGFSDPLRYWIF